MYEKGYALDYTKQGDSLDSFAQKYMNEIDRIYKILNEIKTNTCTDIDAGQLKVENGVLYIRNTANTEWINVGLVAKHLGLDYEAESYKAAFEAMKQAAATSKANAATSATAAATSETNAADSATTAQNAASVAENFAVAEDKFTHEGQEYYSSKWWAGQSKGIAFPDKFISNTKLADSATVHYATVAEMKAAKLVDGQIVKTAGYYSTNDGGDAFYTIKTSSSKYAENLSNGLVAELIVENDTVNVKQFGAVGDGITDDSDAIQNAINSAHNVIINATCKVGKTIHLNSESHIIGYSKSTVLLTSDMDDFMFDFTLSTDNIRTSIIIERIFAQTKNFFKANDYTNDETTFESYPHILGILITNCRLLGKYSDSSDVNVGTGVEPTLDELREYGVGIQLTKCFDSCIELCEINHFGIGVLFNGTDLSTIQNNRIVDCARLIHLINITDNYYGSQTLIHHNDLLSNNRIYAIYTTSRYDVIDGNYFETYTAAAVYIYVDGYGTRVINNRFDNDSNCDTVAIFANIKFHTFANNIVNTNAGRAARIKFTNYASMDDIQQKRRSYFYGNNIYCGLVANPFVVNGTREDNSTIDCNSNLTLLDGGTGISVTPLLTANANGKLYFTNSEIIFRLVPSVNTGKFYFYYDSNSNGYFLIEGYKNGAKVGTAYQDFASKRTSILLTMDADYFQITSTVSDTQLCFATIVPVYAVS